MYKQQTHAPDRHHQRDAQDDFGPLQECQARPAQRIQPNRRTSDPITLFSNNASDVRMLAAGASAQPILPRIGPSGLFAGQTSHDAQSLLSSMTDTTEAQTVATHTSLGSALEEVLESVDQATEELARARCQQRITDWLNQQPSLSSDTKKRRRQSGSGQDDEDEQTRVRRLSARVLRDLLKLDADTYALLVQATTSRGRQTLSAAQQAHARAMEQQLLGCWTGLSQRDTAGLQCRLVRCEQTSLSQQETLSGRVPLWGIPEEVAGQQEEGSVQVLLRFLRSFLFDRPVPAPSNLAATFSGSPPATAVSASSTLSSGFDQAVPSQQMHPRAAASVSSTASQSQATPHPSHPGRPPRLAYLRTLAGTGSLRHGSRPASSVSSSFKTVSLQTGGSLSRAGASLRRGMQEGGGPHHFWEVASFRSSLQSGGGHAGSSSWVI